MIKLVTRSPAEGQVPFEGAGILVTEVPDDLATLSVGRNGPDALWAQLGLVVPPRGQSAVTDGRIVTWFDHAHLLVIGAHPPIPDLNALALTDQSDAWAHLRLTGGNVPGVLARLTSIDLRDIAFPAGSSARTELAHMPGIVLRLEGEWRLMVYRSMACTLIRELKRAMVSVAR